MKLLNKIDIRQLRILQGLLKERNLSRVAEKMDVSQQAISDQLRKLRDTFDDRLFIRTSNGVIPTPFVESLKPKIDHILESLENLLKPDIFEPATATDLFSISSTDFEQRVILPKLVNLLRQKAPNLKLAVRKLELDKLAESLMTGDVDLVISNPAFVPESYPSMLLYNENYVCVAGKTNKKVKKKMSVAAIAQIPQLVVSPSSGEFSGAANLWFEEQGHPRNVVLSVPTFTAAKACIGESDLCGFIPSRLLPDLQLKTIELEEYPPNFEVIAVWHQRSNQDPLHIWIRGQLKKLVG